MPKIESAPTLFVRKRAKQSPLWQGPCGTGWNGGVTQSMLSAWLSCRERARIKYVLGLRPEDKWNKHLGFGSCWHAAEEALAGKKDYRAAIRRYHQEQTLKYPMQREEISKWASVCMVQFPEYEKYWAAHPDVQDRRPLMQEQTFDVPYALPSGRVVRMRGKFDAVDLIPSAGGIFLQENKTKSDIDESDLTRQMKMDLQSQFYLVALRELLAGWRGQGGNQPACKQPIKGVRYNVVRRPLSGGRGNIQPHRAKYTDAVISKRNGAVLHPAKHTPAETNDEFFERLRRDYLADDPGYWFFRMRVEVFPSDVSRFEETCLKPVLENLCWWYDEVTGAASDCPPPPANWTHPFGTYNALTEGGATEYDAYILDRSMAGLRRAEELFEELREPEGSQC